jgi:hypothetical protein
VLWCVCFGFVFKQSTLIVFVALSGLQGLRSFTVLFPSRLGGSSGSCSPVVSEKIILLRMNETNTSTKDPGSDRWSCDF